MLVVPMKNQKDEVIGVLQLINAKRHAARQADFTRQIVHQEVIPFSQRSQELASSLASQAAVALENNLLYRDIQRLFEGFVKASVTAIESRDPTTFGHSERVAKLTVGLAEAVDRSDSRPYQRHPLLAARTSRKSATPPCCTTSARSACARRCWSRPRSSIPPQMELINKRFQYIRKVLELEAYRKKLDYVLANGNQNYQPIRLPRLRLRSTARNCQQLDEFLAAHPAGERADRAARKDFGETGGDCRLEFPGSLRAHGTAAVRRGVALPLHPQRQPGPRRARADRIARHPQLPLPEPDSLDQGTEEDSRSSPARTTRNWTAAATRTT